MSGQRNQQAVRLLLQALLAPHGRRMALGVLLAASTTLAGVLLLGISGWFLAGTAMAGLLGAAAIAFDVFTPSASIRLLALGRTASRYGERVVTHQATLQALVQVRERLFRAYAARGAGDMSVADMEGGAVAYAARGAGDGSRWRLHPGRMLLRLTRDLDAAESLYLRLIVPTAAALCGTLLISLWLAWHHPGLGVASLCWFLLWGFGIVLWLVRSTTRLSLAQSRLAERLRQQSLDLAGAQTELVMANQFDAWLARWQQTEARLAALDAQLQRRDALAAALWQILHALTMAAAAMAAGWLVLQHGMSVPNAAFLLLMAMAGMEPFAAMRRGALEWSASLLAARRLATPLIFGVAMGNVLQGVPFRLEPDMQIYYDGTFFGLLNPFALLCGLVSVAMLAAHGAAWLQLKTEGAVQQRARRYGRVFALLTPVLFILAGVMLWLTVDGYRITSEVVTTGPSNPMLKTAEGGVAGMWFANYAQAPVLWLVPALGVLGSLVAAWGFTQRRELLTLLANGVAVASTVLCVGVSMFPFILPSSVQPRASLTVWDASSSHMILFIMLVASIIFIPIILAYTSWVYSVMRGKVTEDEIEGGGGHAY